MGARYIMLGMLQASEGLPLCQEVFDDNTAEVATIRMGSKRMLSDQLQ